MQVGRVIELLASQIYQSPLALLRENAQNAFDAVLMRRAGADAFQPRIDVSISPNTIEVTDNGIGMTPLELETHYWRAGSSGKNTSEARAAGVVGTFGIGAMANFGVADTLTVVTESAREPLRTRSSVRRAELSTTNECITLESLEPLGAPGTTVSVQLEEGSQIDVGAATKYIAQFVEFVNVPVFVNGVMVSGRELRDLLPSERAAWREHASDVDLGGLAAADAEVLGLASGDLRVHLTNLRTKPEMGPRGGASLVQGTSALRTLRSGFGLATVSTASIYRLGGAIDLAVLKPTAGREALEDSSNLLLQRLFKALDGLVSRLAAGHRETLENNAFLGWVVSQGRFDLCGPLAVRVEPGNQQRALETLVSPDRPIAYYTGSDDQMIRAYASEGQPLIVVSRRAPRRDCELGFLRKSGAKEVRDEPQVLAEIPASQMSVAHGAVAFRIELVLAEDYFIQVHVSYAKMSHNLPVLVDKKRSPVVLYLDPGSNSLAPLLELYLADYATFVPFVKDFVRANVFPKVSDLVPSSTREGADAFLKRLRSRNELFEIDWTDRRDLEEIWQQYAEGRINLTEAAKLSRATPRRSVVVVREAASIASVVPALEDSTPDSPEVDLLAALPPVDRREASTDALLLTGDPLNGYSCFVALSDRAQQQSAEFFFQPHTTSVVWGGQKVLFVFMHHSGRFGVYYDVQCPGLVGATSGGGPVRTSTLLLKNRTFIPVPSEIAHNFIPVKGQRVRLEVRCDVIYMEAEAQVAEITH